MCVMKLVQITIGVKKLTHLENQEVGKCPKKCPQEKIVHTCEQFIIKFKTLNKANIGGRKFKNSMFFFKKQKPKPRW